MRPQRLRDADRRPRIAQNPKIHVAIMAGTAIQIVLHRAGQFQPLCGKRVGRAGQKPVGGARDIVDGDKAQHHSPLAEDQNNRGGGGCNTMRPPSRPYFVAVSVCANGP